MEFRFDRGFSLYRKEGDSGLIIAAPHSGPALETVTSRDHHSETVASICWKNMGGTLIISHMPRKRLLAVDFNRDIPPQKLALEMFNVFLLASDNAIMENYRRNYGWVARDAADYEMRLSIYQNFWEEINKGDCILLIHRAFSRIKTIPSIMDVVSFGKRTNLKILNAVVDHINKKYSSFFKAITKDYRNAIVFESRRTVLKIMRVYDGFDPKQIGVEFQKNLKKDIEVIYKYADKYAADNLKRNFTPYYFVEAVKNAVVKTPEPRLTVSHVFSGDIAHGPKRKLLPDAKRIILEIEPCEFMNLWHPQMAARIIQDLVRGLQEYGPGVVK